MKVEANWLRWRQLDEGGGNQMLLSANNLKHHKVILIK